MYDLGISSQLTRSEPFVLEAARELDGASFVVEGTAVAEEMEMRFAASVPVRQTDSTELGVPVIRKSSSAPFDHDVRPEEPGLLLRFDPTAWLQGVDFRPYLEQAQGGSGRRTITLAPDSEAFRALSIALSTVGRPDFHWGYGP
jgi:hypothetical protein